MEAGEVRDFPPPPPNTKHCTMQNFPSYFRNLLNKGRHIFKINFTLILFLFYLIKLLATPDGPKMKSWNTMLTCTILKYLDHSLPVNSLLKRSLGRWKVLIDLRDFRSVVCFLPRLICNASLIELQEQWWNGVYYLPHQVINDFINKTDNKTVISSTLLWKMIPASRSIFQGLGFSVAALSPFNIFHRQRKVKIHFETNFN